MKFFKKRNVKRAKLPAASRRESAKITPSPRTSRDKSIANMKRRPNLQLEGDSDLNGNFYPIEVDNNNIVQRILTNVALDSNDLHELIDVEVGELVKKYLPPKYPKIAPISGKLVAMNWGQLIETSGVNNNDHKSLGTPHPDGGGQKWYRRHAPWYAAWYVINPIYQFFTGDNPLFYCYKPVSHIDPVTQQEMPPDKIIWKIDGEEVHEGPYFMQHHAPESNGVRMLTMEIHNSMGITSENLSYEITDPDDAGGHTESTFATYEGQWKFSELGYSQRDPRISNSRDYSDQPIEWEEDPTAFARRIIFAFDWSSMGKGHSWRKRIGRQKPVIKIDGINIGNKMDAMWFNGDRTKYITPNVLQEYSGDYGVLNMHPTVYTGDYKLYKGGRPGRTKGLHVPEESDDYLKPSNWTSAITQKADRGEFYHWHRPLELVKKPGEFTLSVEFEITWKPWFSKTRIRTYKWSKTYDIDRNNLKPVLDLGIIEVGYTTRKK